MPACVNFCNFFGSPIICAFIAGACVHVVWLRLAARWPHLAGQIKSPDRSFPVAMHGDDGTGLADDSTLLLTWAPGWFLGADGTNTWLMRFPYIVVPHSRCLPETIPFVMRSFVQACEA